MVLGSIRVVVCFCKPKGNSDKVCALKVLDFVIGMALSRKRAFDGVCCAKLEMLLMPAPATISSILILGLLKAARSETLASSGMTGAASSDDKKEFRNNDLLGSTDTIFVVLIAESPGVSALVSGEPPGVVEVVSRF